MFAVSFVTFLIFQLAPALSHTSPVYYYVGKIPPEPVQLQLLEHRFGFDLPWWEQYWHYISGICSAQTSATAPTTSTARRPAWATRSG